MDFKLGHYPGVIVIPGSRRIAKTKHPPHVSKKSEDIGLNDRVYVSYAAENFCTRFRKAQPGGKESS